MVNIDNHNAIIQLLGATGTASFPQSSSSSSDLGLSDFWPVFFLSITILSCLFSIVCILCFHLRYMRLHVESIEFEGLEEQNLNEEGEIAEVTCWTKLANYKQFIKRSIQSKQYNMPIVMAIIAFLFCAFLSVFILLFIVDSFTVARSNSELDSKYNNNGDSSEYNLNYGLLSNDCWAHITATPAEQNMDPIHIRRCLIIRMSSITAFVFAVLSGICSSFTCISLLRNIQYNTSIMSYSWRPYMTSCTLNWCSTTFSTGFLLVWGLSAHFTIQHNTDTAELATSFYCFLCFTIVYYVISILLHTSTVYYDWEAKQEKIRLYEILEADDLEEQRNNNRNNNNDNSNNKFSQSRNSENNGRYGEEEIQLQSLNSNNNNNQVVGLLHSNNSEISLEDIEEPGSMIYAPPEFKSNH